MRNIKKTARKCYELQQYPKFNEAGGAPTGSNGAGSLSAGLPPENLNCYAGSGSGIIYYLNDNG